MCKHLCTGSNWKHIPGALILVDVDDTRVWGVDANDIIVQLMVVENGSMSVI